MKSTLIIMIIFIWGIIFYTTYQFDKQYGHPPTLTELVDVLFGNVPKE